MTFFTAPPSKDWSRRRSSKSSSPAVPWADCSSSRATLSLLASASGTASGLSFDITFLLSFKVAGYFVRRREDSPHGLLRGGQCYVGADPLARGIARDELLPALVDAAHE